VIKADSTRGSMKLLKAIQNKEIDDSILKNLHITQGGVRYEGMTDERIVAELRKQKFPDYMAHDNMRYEVRRSKDGLHKRIRNKTMG